jgi:predicted nucleic acid-binding protein
MIYALDTNILIDMLRSSPAIRAERNAAVDRGDMMIIPPFVHYEMRRGFLYKPAPAKESAYRAFCSRFSVGEMTAEIWERAAVLYARLRRAGRIIGDADILIAAFCVVNSFTLVTNNIKHFEGIEGLRLEDWTAKP